ncbi:phosphatase PAP2 family protein [Blastococcus atacamensis]|uniref:phosphatase PAP2 family protein n=1 Tax=Blastococcus atacamensis TaxID=2070508 RepID=UPI001E5519CD|nr:phosphatase PAP2 family protein [Blastococcus atacamensis]
MIIWSAPRWWPLVAPLALGVAAARVGLGVHYPHDVVDGSVFGGVVGSVLVLLLRRPATRWVTAGCRRVRPLSCLAWGTRPR